MSGLVKSIGKKFRKAGPLGKIAMIAAVWWAAGAAASYFSAPAAGTGAATAASTETAFTAATAGAPVAASEVAAVAAEAGAATAASTATATEAAIASSGAIAPAAANMGAMAPTAASAGAAIAPAAPVASGGMTTGQMAALMVGGQAISGYAQAQEAKEQREADEKARRERGLMGFDYEGRYAGQPRGIIASQTPEPTTTDAMAGPEVAPQTVNAPQAPQVRPIERANLPQLRKQGLIAQQQVS